MPSEWSTKNKTQLVTKQNHKSLHRISCLGHDTCLRLHFKTLIKKIGCGKSWTYHCVCILPAKTVSIQNRKTSRWETLFLKLKCFHLFLNDIAKCPGHTFPKQSTTSFRKGINPPLKCSCSLNQKNRTPIREKTGGVYIKKLEVVNYFRNALIDLKATPTEKKSPSSMSTLCPQVLSFLQIFFNFDQSELW